MIEPAAEEVMAVPRGGLRSRSRSRSPQQTGRQTRPQRGRAEEPGQRATQGRRRRKPQQPRDQRRG